MKSRLLALLFTLACLVAAPSLRVTADWIGGPPVYAQAAPAATPAPVAGSARVWEGRNQEFEDDLRTAEIDQFEDVPIGVTKPKRAYFKPGGMVESVAWKMLPPGRPQATGRATSPRSPATSSTKCSASRWCRRRSRRSGRATTAARDALAVADQQVEGGGEDAEAARVRSSGRQDEDVRQPDRQHRSQHGQPAGRRRRGTSS